MSAIRIKKGDVVRIIAGKDKDKEGKVIAVDQKKKKGHCRRCQHDHKAY